MTEFSELVVPFMLMLFAINTMFAFTGYLPNDQGLSGDNLSLIDNNEQVFGYITSFYDDVNLVTGQDGNGSYVDAGTENKTYIEPAKALLFGIPGTEDVALAIGYFGTFMKYIGQIFFGYTIWVDYFFNPIFGPAISVLGGMFKFFFFMIQVYGGFIVLRTIFGLGSGGRF